MPDLESPPTEGIAVNADLVIPRSELEFRTSRSSGAGGQHVNKTSSRVEISWNIAQSKALSDEQRELLIAKLPSRISEEGAIRVVASDTRIHVERRVRHPDDDRSWWGRGRTGAAERQQQDAARGRRAQHQLSTSCFSSSNIESACIGVN